MTTEILPPEDPITGMILLGAAISPEYDLRPALRRVSGGIHNCYSHLDLLYLGAGTLLAGTIDRQHVPAAGQVGFSLPADDSAPDQALFAKLHQWRWTRRMWQMGNDGGHLGWTNRRFACHWIAPLILANRDNQESLRKPGGPIHPTSDVEIECGCLGGR
ncbi:MAG: hypothetical protein ACE5EC_04765 [Phycisphaerae bacterium]